MANFFLKFPEHLSNEIASLNNGDLQGKMALSLIDDFTLLQPDVRESLAKQNWVRSVGEPCYDTHFNNLLNHALSDKKIVTSLKQILSHMLSIKSSASLQRMVQSCIPLLLEHEDEFEMLTNYFTSSISEEPEAQEIVLLDHLKDNLLPNFSDEECHLSRFNTDPLMRNETNMFAVKKIIRQFEDKPKSTFMTIKVDHFSLNFKATMLKTKIAQFNKDPAGIKG